MEKQRVITIQTARELQEMSKKKESAEGPDNKCRHILCNFHSILIFDIPALKFKWKKWFSNQIENPMSYGLPKQNVQ